MLIGEIVLHTTKKLTVEVLVHYNSYSLLNKRRCHVQCTYIIYHYHCKMNCIIIQFERSEQIAIVGVYKHYFCNVNVPTVIWKDCFVPATNRCLVGTLITVWWKARSAENAECGKRGVWKMRSVENEKCEKWEVWKMRGIFIMHPVPFTPSSHAPHK